MHAQILNDGLCAQGLHMGNCELDIVRMMFMRPAPLQMLGGRILHSACSYTIEPPASCALQQLLDPCCWHSSPPKRRAPTKV